MKQLRKEILPALGFKNIFLKAGYESDDIITFVIDQNRGEHYPIVIVSSDNDLLQLIDYDTSFYNFKERITFDIFTKRIDGLAPWYWAEAKAIGGCDSDNVKGIKGISDPAKSFNKDTGKYTSGALKYLKGTASEKLIKKMFGYY